MNDLKAIAPEIAAYVERYYADLPGETIMLDILSPHAMAHRIAETHPGLGAAFYRTTEAAARECWNTMLGIKEAPVSSLPRRRRRVWLA